MIVLRKNSRRKLADIEKGFRAVDLNDIKFYCEMGIGGMNRIYNIQFHNYWRPKNDLHLEVNGIVGKVKDRLLEI